jgi:hypothetical protein
MARVKDGLSRHLAQAPKALEMQETVVHLQFGRMQDARASKQIIQLWVAAPEREAFYFLTQMQALHNVTQISNSLRYMWVVSKESRKLQSPLFDRKLIISPNLRALPSFERLVSYWMRLYRATGRITLDQLLNTIKVFYTEHGMMVPTILDVYVLQNKMMASEPSFMLCLASVNALAQLASDLQPLGLLRAKLGLDFFIRLGAYPDRRDPGERGLVQTIGTGRRSTEADFWRSGEEGFLAKETTIGVDIGRLGGRADPGGAAGPHDVDSEA